MTREKLKDLLPVQLSWERKPEMSLTVTDAKNDELAGEAEPSSLHSPLTPCATNCLMSMTNHSSKWTLNISLPGRLCGKRQRIAGNEDVSTQIHLAEVRDEGLG